MDWLEEAIEKIRRKLIHSTLKKTLIIYIFLAIITVILCSMGTIRLCENWEALINERYMEKELNMVSYNYYVPITSMSHSDQMLFHIIEFIKIWSIFLYSVIAIILTSKNFYMNKLDEPLALLREEAKYISRNDLNFECLYESKDEMGELCKTFNMMRLQLIENNKKMWNLMEEQRRLNAAFAHDMRTPLTVLYGYTDLLMKYYPEGKISDKKLMEYFSMMQEQITRLRSFSNTMKEVNRLEEIEIVKEEIVVDKLISKIENTVHILNEDSKLNNKMIVYSFILIIKEKVNIFVDAGVILEVLENILSNASRYANNKIEVYLEVEEDSKELSCYVKDDGRGFTKEELRMADKPYYTDRNKGSSEHFGIGLFICKILCEKHGGKLSLLNSMEGGAIVQATFYSK